MRAKFSIKCILMTVAMAVTAQSSFSATVMSVCPSPDMLKNFNPDYIQTDLNTFDSQQGRMLVTVLQNRKFSDDDPTLGGYGRLVFIMTNVPQFPGTDSEKTAQAAAGQLQLDSETPYRYYGFKGVVVPVCTYSSPSDGIKAMVIQEPKIQMPVAIV